MNDQSIRLFLLIFVDESKLLGYDYFKTIIFYTSASE